MPDHKINTVLIDKNQTGLKELQSLLKKTGNISVTGTATTGKEGISLIINSAPQLAFINVDLQDIDGLEFVRILHNRNIFPEIVFTADDNYLAYESLQLEPFDFLIKPVKKEDIISLLSRLNQKYKKEEFMRKMDVFTKSNSVYPKRIFRQKTGIILLELSEIVFIKASLAFSVLTLVTGQEVPLKTTLAQTMETINKKDFIRINRSYCINRNYLQKIDRRNLKYLMQYEDKLWEVPASKNTIAQLEKLSVYPIH